MSNSPVTETGYSAEYLQDGVYSITTTTRYNAAGQPLISVQKRLISQLSGTLESKSVFVNERGLTSTQWTVYSGGTKRVQYSTVPGSSITAETVTVSGVALLQKDTAGITTTATRSYTANGMVLTQTDGRGNTTTTVTDKAGRAYSIADETWMKGLTGEYACNVPCTQFLSLYALEHSLFSRSEFESMLNKTNKLKSAGRLYIQTKNLY